jgi:hypothetical protein
MSGKFRELNTEEQVALFAVYCKYQGNKIQMAKSGECTFNRNILGYYEKIYDFKSRMLQDVADRANQDITITREKLLEAKNKAIQRAIDLLDLGYDYKNVKAAWEIIKVELGEPTTINQNNNNNNDSEQLDNVRSQLNELMKYAKAGTANNPGGPKENMSVSS